LGDSVAQLPSAPVYAQQGDQAHFAGFCGVKDGAARTMLLLPGMRPSMKEKSEEEKSPLPQFFEIKKETQGEGNGGDGNQGDGDVGVELPTMTIAQQHVLAWAVHLGSPVYLGACDRLQEYLPAALAMDPQDGDSEIRVLVDLAGAGDPNIATVPADGAVPVDAIQRAVAVEGLSGTSAAGVAQGIVNDASCPGNYVMGTVVNKEGAPLPGIRLEMTDQWGNHTYATSKSGQSDYGMFDFPIYGGDGAQNLQLAVVDGNNNPTGAAVIVPHKMDAASDTPCHHVVIRGDG